MRFLAWILIGFLTVVVGSGCSGPKVHLTAPNWLKVERNVGLEVYSDVGPSRYVIGTLQRGTQVRVIDAIPSYFRIIIDGKAGWVPANSLDRWTREMPGDKVEILRSEGIPVRRNPDDSFSPPFAIARYGEAYHVTGRYFSVFQISFKQSKGWVIINSKNRSWVEFIYD